MKLLLDTHILLWWLDGHRALPVSARGLISDPANLIFVSAVSLWEIWLKVSLKKLKLPPDFTEKLAAEGFESLPLNAEHAREVARLPWHHRDPFDRMLIAQARVSGMRFLSADAVAAKYGAPVLLAN